MGTTGWIILGVIVLAVVYLIFLYNRLVSAPPDGRPVLVGHLRPAQAAPRPRPQPGRDGEGLRHPRARRRFEAVVKARNAAVAAQGPAAQAQAENMLTGALRQLFALAEAYPDLKANQNFLQLQSELADLENKIAASRRFFNNAVQEYNTSIEQFPAVFIARQHGLPVPRVLRARRGRARGGPGPAAGQVLKVMWSLAV